VRTVEQQHGLGDNDASDAANAGRSGYDQTPGWPPNYGNNPAAPSPGYGSPPPSAANTFCSACGRPLDPSAMFCPFDGAPQQQRAWQPMTPMGVVRPTPKSGGLAIFLHFLFPGAGHLYAGIGDRATGYLIASAISCLFAATVIGLPVAFIIWLVCFIKGLGEVQGAVASFNLAIGVPEIRPPGY
jgi:hypothetical protein